MGEPIKPGISAEKNIAIIVPPRAVGMSVALIQDLCWVGLSKAAALTGNKIDPAAHIHLASFDGRPVKLFTGSELSVAGAFDDIPAPDIVFLCAFWGSIDDILAELQGLPAWLATQHQRGVSIAAFSNAPFFLAEAGLLDNRAATIYPPSSKAFAERYPKVQLVAERAITDANNVFCANGISSGCDLIISMIENLFGSMIASEIREEYLVGFNRSYFLSSISFDGQKYHQDLPILSAQNWLENNYQQNINLSDVAANCGMSARNFTRRFLQATGDRPSHYLQRIRTEVAKDLLRNTDQSISEIAYHVGYSDLSHFSRLFQRHTGTLPNAFRTGKTQKS